jgi:hypothetical protein
VHRLADDRPGRRIACEDRQVSGDFDGVGAESVAELRSEGFIPIEELTGQVEFALAWPEAHRRAVLDTRYEPESLDDAIPGLTDGTLYLVRSPWESVGTEEAIDLLQRWVRRHRPKASPTVAVKQDSERELTLAKQFLDQDECWVRAYREGHVRPTR